MASYLRVNPRATPEKIQQYKETNGLIGSPPEQYFHWLGHFLTGELGQLASRATAPCGRR